MGEQINIVVVSKESIKEDINDTITSEELKLVAENIVDFHILSQSKDVLLFANRPKSELVILSFEIGSPHDAKEKFSNIFLIASNQEHEVLKSHQLQV